MRLFRALLALVVLLAAFPAAAAVRITFYSHAWNAGGDGMYPHAFVRATGAPQWAPDGIDETFGFTAGQTPAVFTRARGRIQPADAGYVARSTPHFWVEVSDEEYRALRERIDGWNRRPGSDYNLYRRNCIHFAADVARGLGLQVGDTKTLKPEVFMAELVTLNGSQVALGAAPSMTPALAALGR